MAPKIKHVPRSDEGAVSSYSRVSVAVMASTTSAVKKSVDAATACMMLSLLVTIAPEDMAARCAFLMRATQAESGRHGSPELPRRGRQHAPVCRGHGDETGLVMHPVELPLAPDLPSRLHMKVFSEFKLGTGTGIPVRICVFWQGYRTAGYA